MAQRRMFSLSIVDTDRFLDMPQSAQNLYFHMGMRADDDGFVGSPNKIIKAVGAAADDIKLLIAKGYIIPFESGVCVITDWCQNNYLQKDRYRETIYKQEKSLLNKDANGSYTSCIQGVYELDTQVRLGKVSVGKDIKPSCASGDARTIEKAASFAEFWAAYPKKKSKGEAEKAWKVLKPSKELVAIMLDKLAQAKTCEDWTKEGGKYIPYPATWLRAKGWEDELTPVVIDTMSPEKIAELERKYGGTSHES